MDKAYDEMRDSYLQLKEQYSNLFKENQRLKDAGHNYEDQFSKLLDRIRITEIQLDTFERANQKQEASIVKLRKINRKLEWDLEREQLQQALNCTKPEEMRKLKNKNKNLEKNIRSCHDIVNNLRQRQLNAIDQHKQLIGEIDSTNQEKEKLRVKLREAYDVKIELNLCSKQKEVLQTKTKELQDIIRDEAADKMLLEEKLDHAIFTTNSNEKLLNEYQALSKTCEIEKDQLVDKTTQQAEQISYFSSKHKKCAQQIEALRGQRAANENEMSDMHVSFRKYANESEFRINELKSEKLKLSEEITLCQYSLSTFKTKIITVTSQLNSTEDDLNDCFHNSHKLELDQNKNVRQWSEQRKELSEKIEAARDQIVKCQQEKKNNRLKGVFFDACDARLAKCEKKAVAAMSAVESCHRRIKAQNSQTQIQKGTVNTVKDEESLVQEEVHSQDDLEESDDLIPDEIDLTPNFSFNNSETSHGFVPVEPEIIDQDTYFWQHIFFN
jgi:chromosome segregation ATPase